MSFNSEMKPAAFLSAKDVVAICCGERILGENEDSSDEEEWLTMTNERTFRSITSEEIECIYSLLIQNDMDSFSIFSINLDSFRAMLAVDALSELSDKMVRQLLEMFKDRFPLNWYNIIEAAKHENNAIACELEKLIAQNGGLSDFGNLMEVKARSAIIESMKKDRKATTPMEIKYTRGLFDRAVNRTWISADESESSLVSYLRE